MVQGFGQHTETGFFEDAIDGIIAGLIESTQITGATSKRMEVSDMHDQMGEHKNNLIDLQRVDKIGIIANLLSVSAGGFYLLILTQPHAKQQGSKKRVIQHRPCNRFCQL